MERKYLRFADLKAMGICSNWQTLGLWIRTQNFPEGIKLSLNTRVWPQSEVVQWIESRKGKK
jgi:predicted DNA-binding transcriptional regulator AlpA